MADKVTFNGVTKLVVIKNGITSIDFQRDVYSTWKEWKFEITASSPNSKFFQAIRTTGGDPTIGSGAIAPYFFFFNGCRMRPFEGNHTLYVEGNVAVDESSDRYIVPTTGSNTVLVNTIFSNNATVLTVQVGSGLSSDEQTKLDELWRIQGLDINQPLTVAPSYRLCGSVTQSIISGSDGLVIVTRT